MRIVYVTAGLPYSSGQEEFFLPEISELARRGHQLLIVPRQKMGSVGGDEARRLLGSTRALSLLAPEVLAVYFRESLRRPIPSLRALWTVCSRGRASKLPKNLAVFPKALWLARVAREFGADHIHVQWLGTTASMAMVASRLTGIPWSVTAHRWDIADNNLLEEKLRAAAFVRFISNKSMAMAESLCSFDISRSFVLHLGVPDGQCSPVTDRAARRLVCPANMIPVKGHKHLLEAIAILRERQVECELILAGDGPLRKTLERTAASLGISDIIRLVGRLPHDELLSLYQRGEVGLVVLPSVDLVEAMAYGVPVVSTETGGIPELLSGGAGVMVPPADSRALADAIASIIGDVELRRSLSVCGRQRAENDYSVTKVIDMLERRFLEAS
jgi:glycosyltransferase involved in cell wall biosynthesis